MKKYCLKHLPHWVLTDPQPAFYDCESATSVQQTAKIYAKIQELITLYNEFTNDVNRYITEFEEGIIKDFNCFQNCIIKTMNDYIETIDMKINLQDSKIEESINNQNAIIQNAVDYMKENLVSTVTTLFNNAVHNGDITANLLEAYDSDDESLVLSIVASEESDV
jgi:hypothetical protein